MPLTFRSGLLAGIAASLGAGLGARAAQAQETLEVVGRPVNGETGFQFGATELARDLQNLDFMLLVIISAITLFVTVLLAIVVVRFNRRSNPDPASFTHNTPLEVSWTVIPILILVFIGAYSLPVLFKQQEIPPGDVTIKVTGYQWYWGYEYVDEGIEFASFLVDGSTKVDSLGDDQPIGQAQVLDDIAVMKLEALGYTRDDFLLATDTAVVVPVNKTVVMQVTGADVIHSWTIPAFGVKQDAVPGRIAQLWFKPEREGIYFGQCSELCGKSHAYMPITVKVVSEAAYARWLESAKAGDAQLSSLAGPSGDVKVAAAN
ncbi:MAG: cytochrome c oxidase subunit II [Rhodobacter sp.]|nr:cytochrome c oxidase subunit II [Rhodobacter sp.]MCA3492794.1 cytochrome c oxidase subunit II [Rhodobacter sp.]MCA3501583.1 cytochrome c oxidase subunit II [Rhodobacter sp.]MCA3503942.1 cytochrome c oxidase subunit II [Rhodobacter sp.]MCA3516451.1 cytochrome c oxidase subunit II [Rhodobacter sp.]